MKAGVAVSHSSKIKSVTDRFSRLLIAPVGKETLGSMGLKLANVGLAFVGSVLLARALGPADYGVYAYAYALITLLSVLSEFGLPILLVRETARGVVNKDYGLVKGIWHWSGLVSMFLSFLLAGGAVLFFVFTDGALDSRRLDTFLWGLALLPLIALGDLRGAALRGLQRVLAGQLPEFLLRPGFFVILLAVGMAGATILSASLAMGLYVIASALAFLVGAWLLWRVTPKEINQAVPRYEGRAWLASALPIAFLGGMVIINQQVAILLQGFFLTDAEIGIFRVATQASQLAAFGLMAINMVVAPRFATLYAQGEMGKLQRLMTRSGQAILIFNLIITAGFTLLGKPFLRLVFDVSFLPAYAPLMVLLIGQFINSGVGPVAWLLTMTNYERETAKARLYSTILNIALNLLLLPWLGILGSSIAVSISLIAWNVILWWVVRKKLGINSLAFLPRKGE